jgi:hypothetical protein
MRLIGMILALGVIMWIMFQAAGGDKADGIIPQEYQKSMEKAEGVEKTVHDAAQLRLQELDENSQ